MKYFGSILEFTRERNADIMRAYRTQLIRADKINMPSIFAAVAEMPSSRFWVSEERAAVVISAMMRGCTISRMRRTKIEMFTEIYRRVMEIRRSQPGRSLSDIITEVIHQPAPKFYMEPGSIKMLVCHIKRGMYESSGKYKSRAKYESERNKLSSSNNNSKNI